MDGMEPLVVRLLEQAAGKQADDPIVSVEMILLLLY